MRVTRFDTAQTHTHVWDHGFGMEVNARAAVNEFLTKLGEGGVYAGSRLNATDWVFVQVAGSPRADDKLGVRLVPCPGEAHNPEVGGMIDNCMMCAPRWGKFAIPFRHETFDSWRAEVQG
jgi:hypothetical protein